MKNKKFSNKLLARIMKEQERMFWESRAYKTLMELEKKNLA